MPGSVTSRGLANDITVSVYQKGVYGNVFKDYSIIHKVYALSDTHKMALWRHFRNQYRL